MISTAKVAGSSDERAQWCFLCDDRVGERCDVFVVVDCHTKPHPHNSKAKSSNAPELMNEAVPGRIGKQNGNRRYLLYHVRLLANVKRATREK